MFTQKKNGGASQFSPNCCRLNKRTRVEGYIYVVQAVLELIEERIQPAYRIEID
jgi:hypothetical protein